MPHLMTIRICSLRSFGKSCSSIVNLEVHKNYSTNLLRNWVFHWSGCMKLCEANHSELWKITTSMENHKSEFENWDLGAGIYISFYLIRSSLEEDNNTMSEPDSLESKNDACKDILGCLNDSLSVWGGRLPVEARVAYPKMAEEICDLLLSDISEGPSREAQLNCFDTIFSAPIPEDLHSNHLHNAVSLFTCYLFEIAS